MAKKPFSTKEFKDLEREWKQKLKESGFEDIETNSGTLKDLNRRTISFDNRELLSEFFSELNRYLETHTIPKRDRAILELYCQGQHVKGPLGIANQLGWHFNVVYKTIRLYKTLIVKKN